MALIDGKWLHIMNPVFLRFPVQLEAFQFFRKVGENPICHIVFPNRMAVFALITLGMLFAGHTLALPQMKDVCGGK